MVVLVVYVNEAVRRKRGSLLRERDNTLFLYLYPGYFVASYQQFQKNICNACELFEEKKEINQYNCLGTDSSCCIHP